MTGLEPAIYGVTGRRDNQLRYTLTISIENLQYHLTFVKRGIAILYAKSKLKNMSFFSDIKKLLRRFKRY